MSTRFDVLISLANALAYGPHLSESLRYLRKAQSIQDSEQLRNRIQQLENAIELNVGPVIDSQQFAQEENFPILEVRELHGESV